MRALYRRFTRTDTFDHVRRLLQSRLEVTCDECGFLGLARSWRVAHDAARRHMAECEGSCEVNWLVDPESERNWRHA